MTCRSRFTTTAHTLDVTNEKGRANQAAVDALARSTLDLAAATVTQTGKQEDANGVIQNGRDKLIEHARAVRHYG
jgi:hypothetical protein